MDIITSDVAAYCISLTTRSDRREGLMEHFEAFPSVSRGARVEFFDAINGKTCGLQPNEPPPGCTKMSLGNLGCVLSQIELVKKAKEKNAKWLFIFEDDVRFTSDLDIEIFFDCLPQNADMFYLGANHVEPYHQIDDKIAKCRFALTAHAVGIRNNLFDTVLQILEQKNLPGDLLLATLHKVYNVYAPVKNLAYQAESFSDINDRVVNYECLLEQ